MPLNGWVPWGEDNTLLFKIEESDVFDEDGNQITSGFVIHSPTFEWRETNLVFECFAE